MKIVPCGIPDDSMGKHVDVLGLQGEGGIWNLTISCGERTHKIIIRNGKLSEIKDHSLKTSKPHEYLAEFPETTLSGCIVVGHHHSIANLNRREFLSEMALKTCFHRLAEGFVPPQ